MDNSLFADEIVSWINQQTEAGLQLATIKTVRKMLLEKFQLDTLTKEQKSFIKLTAVSAILKRKEEIKEAKELQAALFSDDDSDDDDSDDDDSDDDDSDDDEEENIPIAQLQSAQKKKAKSKAKSKAKAKAKAKQKKTVSASEKEEDEEEEEEDEEESAFEGDEEEDSDSDGEEEEQEHRNAKRRKTKGTSKKGEAATTAVAVDDGGDNGKVAEEPEYRIEVDMTPFDAETPDEKFDKEAFENVTIYREGKDGAPWSVTLHHPDFNKYFRMQLITHKTSGAMWYLTRDGVAKTSNPKCSVHPMPKRRAMSKFKDVYTTKTGKAWVASTDDDMDTEATAHKYVRVVAQEQLLSLLRKEDNKKRIRSSPRRSSQQSTSPTSSNKRARTGTSAAIFSDDSGKSSESSESSDSDSSDDSSSDDSDSDDEETTLDTRVVSLLKHAANLKAIRKILVDKHCSHPLKKLTRPAINRGFEDLRQLEQIIKNQNNDSDDERDDKNEMLRGLSENFYKHIQHDYDVDPQVCSVMYPIDSLTVSRYASFSCFF
jgi:hypothetical protein